MGTLNPVAPHPAPHPAPHRAHDRAHGESTPRATPGRQSPLVASPVLHIYAAPASGRQSEGPLVAHGLVAELILALLSHGAEVSAYPKGSIELHWGPNGVQGRFHPLWDTTIDVRLRQRFAVVAEAVAEASGPYSADRASHDRGPHARPPSSYGDGLPPAAARPLRRAVRPQGRGRWRIVGTETPPWGSGDTAYHSSP